MNNILFTIKLFIQAGKASSLPPIGPILGQYQLNSIEFYKDFNLQTVNWEESIKLPVIILGYSNGDFEYIIKMPTSTFLLKETIQKEKGSKSTKHMYINILTTQQLYYITFIKYMFYKHIDYNKCNMLCSSAKSIGIYITK